MKAGPEHRSGRIALLTPYDGGNLGDSAIQEALIANLRRSDPNIDVCGITLNPARTSAQHNILCYPLAATSVPHYRATSDQAPQADGGSSSRPGGQSPGLYRRLRRLTRAFPFLRLPRVVFDEIVHVTRSYRLLREVDVLVIAGGGQLDEEWGGSWGHPYGLAKWSILAKAAGVAVVFLSVGACRIKSPLAKLFLKTALSFACYRSYRDAESRRLALEIARHAEGPVVPDLAFSFPVRPCEPLVRSEAASLRVGVSPIAYCHPELWPTKDPVQYERYITELARFVSRMLQDGVTVFLFSSSPPDDQIFADLCQRLDPGLAATARARLSQSATASLGDLLDLLASMDLVVASRLHGLLLSFLLGKPALAISYDRKVKSLMEELGQGVYCLDIEAFNSDDAVKVFSMLQANRDAIVPAVAATCRQYSEVLQQQFRFLVQLLSERTAGRIQSHARASCQRNP